MHEVTEELGGAAMAAERLAKRGVSPVDFAIELLGGVGQAAILMEVSRQHLTRNLLRKPCGKWSAEYVKKLSELSGVSMTLLIAGPPARPPVKRDNPGIAVIRPLRRTK